MMFFDLHDWPLASLVAALLAASLSAQGLPTDRGRFENTAVCEKPGFLPVGVMLTLH
jgi:hypothetical protein